jgi:hypothetical protein
MSYNDGGGVFIRILYAKTALFTALTVKDCATLQITNLYANNNYLTKI